MIDIEPDDWCDESLKMIEEDHNKIIQEDKKLMTKLKKKLKPKIYNEIEKEIEHHMNCFCFSIVDVGSVSGMKEKYSSYCGESSPIRHVYHDVKSFWEDSYHGWIYLRLAKDRYLKMQVSG